MDNEMIERVAEAICNSRQTLRYNGTISTKWRAPEMSKGYIEDCITFAKAAIKAMREPTEKMMISAENKYAELLTFSDKEESGSYLVWQSMIDAIINE